MKTVKSGLKQSNHLHFTCIQRGPNISDFLSKTEKPYECNFPSIWKFKCRQGKHMVFSKEKCLLICVLVHIAERRHTSAAPKSVFVVILHVKSVVFYSWVRLHIVRS